MRTLQNAPDTLSHLVRYGRVTARDEATMRVQVECEDTVTDALVTDWLPVLTPRAHGDRQYDLPDVEDRVLCLFLPIGLEAGFVLGSLYSDNAPPVVQGDKWHRAFKDGTTIEYDRKENRLTARFRGNGIIDVEAEGKTTIRAKGRISLESPDGITLKAPTIALAGNLTQEGYGGGAATSVLRGSFTVREGGIAVPDRDVSAGKVSLRKHEHENVENGPDVSGAPVGG